MALFAFIIWIWKSEITGLRQAFILQDTVSSLNRDQVKILICIATSTILLIRPYACVAIIY